VLSAFNVYYRSLQASNLNHPPATSPTWWEGPTGTDGCVTNVKASLATTNSSYHPILGQQNNWYAKDSRMVAPWNMGLTTRSGTVNATPWGPRLSCWDCHAPAGTPMATVLTGTVTAHGGATTVRGAPTVTGTPSSTNSATLCTTCHAGYTTAGNATEDHGNWSAFYPNGTNSQMVPYVAYGCNRCHGSDYTTAVQRPIRAIDVHGVNVLPPSPVTAKANRWRGASTGSPAQVDARPYAFIRNTRSLANHMPARIGGSTYSATCVHLSDSPCNSRTETYTPGGTY
jgi:hypothetical protein